MGRVMIERATPDTARDADIRTYPVKAGESVQAGDVVDVVGGSVGSTWQGRPNEKKVFASYAVSAITSARLNDSYSIVAFFDTTTNMTKVALTSNVDGTSLGEAIPSSSASTHTSCSRLNDTQFVVGYALGDTLSFEVGVVNGQSISFPGGQSGVTGTNGAGYHALIPLSETQALAVYNNGGLRAKVGILSGYNLNMSGTESPLSGFTNAAYISATRLPDSGSSKRVCVCYTDTGDGNKGKAVIATISASNVVTWGAPVTIDTGEVYGTSCVAIENKIYIAFALSSLHKAYAQVVTASGASISKTGGRLELGDVGIPSVGISSSGGSVVYAHSSFNHVGGSSAGIIELSGTVLSKKGSFPFSKAGVNNLALADVGAGKILICFCDLSGGSEGTATILEVQGDQIAGGFENVSSQAIAMTSAASGQPCEVIFDGTAPAPWATAGQEIASPGVQGYAPQDGWVWVRPEWDAKPFVVGSYTGDGATNRKIELGFTPSAVLVAGYGSFADNNPNSAATPTCGLAIAGLPAYSDRNDLTSGARTCETTVGGFNVFYSTSGKQGTNIAGRNYYYIAFRG